MRFSVSLFWALSVTALAQGQQQASNPPTDISAITVDRKGCFGACPRYTLTLRREGESTYIGRTGPRRGLYAAPLVQAGDFDQLTQVVSKIRFFDLPDVIGPIAIDTEQVVVTVSTAEKSKAITSYDLSKVPAPFATLVMLADRLAAKLLWEDLNEPKNGILGPFPLSRVEPQYTEEARKARLQGSAIVQVQVRPDGTVASDGITIIQGLGMGLDEKAVESVKQWIFKPAYKDGKPAGITMPISVQVEFRL